MARPKKAEKDRRKHPRSTRYSDTELALLEQRAAAAGMDTAEFLREISLKRNFTSRPPLADAQFLLYIRGEVGRTSNNLNQLIEQLKSDNSATTIQAVQANLAQSEEINNEVLKLLRADYLEKNRRSDNKN
ncbi:plasmid mobilization protein [Dyadobacter sp. Leaf189]|uniref:plasmid mobilization protein n=1 Tax=Dyadobacter sp. Leaf189 TaxID=1736295 RepID=UPI0006F4D106|nr:hypothetical protein [Dyadobacter sp. Leaf189]KQS32732.1 hypothetical protein ASG33_01045 [Dyadobacter sp. Leaf189]